MNASDQRSYLVTLVAAAAVLAAGWLAGSRATATNAAAVAPPSSVASLRLSAVLDGLDERAEVEVQLNEFIDERRAQFSELLESLQTVEADLEILRPGTSAYREKYREGLELQAQAQTRQKVLDDIISRETGTMLSDLYRKIKVATAEIAERQGFDIVILDDTNDPLPPDLPQPQVTRFINDRTLLYAGKSVDITEQVRTYMNNAFQSGAGN